MAPVLWRSELRNILAGCMLRKKLSCDEACGLQSEAQGLLAGNEFEVDSRRVLEFVRESNCSAYDCEFVALAIQWGVTLMTMDAKLLKAFAQCAVRLPG